MSIVDKLIPRLLAQTRWPIYLSGTIFFAFQLLLLLLHTSSGLIWWGYIRSDLLWIGAVDCFAITLFLSPGAILLIRRYSDLEKIHANTQRELLDQKTLQSIQKEKLSLYQQIVDYSRDVIWMTDMNPQFTFVSPSIRSMLGYTVDETIQIYPQGVLASKEQFDAMLDKLTQEAPCDTSLEEDVRKTLLVEMELTHRDGSHKWVETSMSLMRSADRTPIGILGCSRDITQKKHLYDELKQAKEYYELMLHNIHDIIYSIDLDLRITTMSPSIRKFLGYTPQELIGRSVLELELIPESYFTKAVDETLRVLQGESLPSEEYQFITKEGKCVWAEVSCAPFEYNGEITGTISVARDITARKEMEESKRQIELRLQRAEKMEAIGLLAGGVAHDLNNALSALIGYAELMLMDLPLTSPLRNNIQKIIESGESAGVIVQDLLTLARRGVQPQREILDINQLILDILNTPDCLKILSDYPCISFVPELSHERLPVLASRAHLHKALMNLLVNAVEAMPEGGSIRIQTERCLAKDLALADKDTEYASDSYAMIRCSDEGIGISETDMKHIFEPFYTKKEMGRSGSGLGLAILWGTIQDHGGFVDGESTVGKGTTFSLFLPLSEDQDNKLQALSEESILGKGEWILIVDDEEKQRGMQAEYLTKLGYYVVVAASGEEAVSILQGREIDIVVLDMVMGPGIDGLETFQRMRKIRPDQRAIVVSGYFESERVKEVLAMGAGTCVRKPFRLGHLAQAIRKELNRP